ncbi:hypothetical protein GF342_05175 [Candidatus Woesearchaeota archaeon]|nr:hypothetical protein [Candidatus Woesearchaeota archaeon]
MHQEVKFLSLKEPQKRVLLKALGYELDEEDYVVNAETGKRLLCKYTNRKISLQDASVLPGSTIVIGSSPYALAKYVEEYLED